MKLLVGYDGSKESEAALQMAQKHANIFGAEIHVITSLRQSSTLDKVDIDRAESELEYTRTPLNIDGIPCETHLCVNYLTAGEDLVKFADENQIDQIYIGIKKRSKVGKFVLGSTAQFVIMHASCPVLAVK
jgi:nucleotide-binding universal stress UspA family protein